MTLKVIHIYTESGVEHVFGFLFEPLEELPEGVEFEFAEWPVTRVTLEPAPQEELPA